jgi:hypothetical protein
LNFVEIEEFDVIFCHIHRMDTKKSFKEQNFFKELQKVAQEKIKQKKLLFAFPKLYNISSLSELFDELNVELYLEIFNAMLNVRTEYIIVMANHRKDVKLFLFLLVYFL